MATARLMRTTPTLSRRLSSSPRSGRSSSSWLWSAASVRCFRCSRCYRCFRCFSCNRCVGLGQEIFMDRGFQGSHSLTTTTSYHPHPRGPCLKLRWNRGQARLGANRIRALQLRRRSVLDEHPNVSHRPHRRNARPCDRWFRDGCRAHQGDGGINGRSTPRGHQGSPPYPPYPFPPLQPHPTITHPPRSLQNVFPKGYRIRPDRIG